MPVGSGPLVWAQPVEWAQSAGEAAYLDMAERHAVFYLANTPADGVPPWDYDAPATGPLAVIVPELLICAADWIVPDPISRPLALLLSVPTFPSDKPALPE